MFTVLLAIDKSEERTMRKARAITDSPLAKEEISAVMVHVAKKVQGDDGRQIDMQEYSELPDSVLLARDHFESAGIDTAVEWRSGEPSDEILDVAKDVDADWIVVGGRKRSAVGKAIFGSVSQEVILNAGCSVLVVND